MITKHLLITTKWSTCASSGDIPNHWGCCEKWGRRVTPYVDTSGNKVNKVIWGTGWERKGSQNCKKMWRESWGFWWEDGWEVMCLLRNEARERCATQGTSAVLFIRDSSHPTCAWTCRKWGYKRPPHPISCSPTRLNIPLTSDLFLSHTSLFPFSTILVCQSFTQENIVASWEERNVWKL